MRKTKNILLVSLILSIIILFQSYCINEISAFTFPVQLGDDKGTVHRVINDKIANDIYLKPEINIVKLTNNEAESQIELKLYGSVNISSRYEYRILIGWKEELYNSYINNWTNFQWSKVIPPESNFTVCVAGGANWSGLTNGSYSAFYNSNDDLVFTEQNNNSVSIFENNTLIFPITETYLENPNEYTEVLVFTSYNATINSSVSDFYIDAIPYTLIINMFSMYTPFAGYTTFYTFLFVLFSGISIATYVKKKKVRFSFQNIK